MVKVEKKIRVHKDWKVMEAKALFDTGSRGSYFSKEFAEKIGYEPYEEPKSILLAVKEKYAKLVGHATVYLEVEGYILPEIEAIGVIEDLLRDAIIGLNIMEKYGIYIEEDEIKFKQIPPTSMII
ncbi:MAG: aspartyl protease family protein [candidate division WOR-3 bacterium]